MFGRKSKVETPAVLTLTANEEYLIELYAELWTASGLPKIVTIEMATSLMTQAITESQSDGTYDLPLNIGDIILGSSLPEAPASRAVVELIRPLLPEMRRDGMTDDDLRGYWNQSEVDRRMMILGGNVQRTALATQTLETGSYESVDEAFDAAGKAVHASFGRFGSTAGFDPNDPNRPLPLEMVSKVIAYMSEFLEAEGAAGFLEALGRAESYNAFYREHAGGGSV